MSCEASVTSLATEKQQTIASGIIKWKGWIFKGVEHRSRKIITPRAEKANNFFIFGSVLFESFWPRVKIIDKIVFFLASITKTNHKQVFPYLNFSCFSILFFFLNQKHMVIFSFS